MEEKQVKSKQRVTEHGEVFTAQREVNAMCDLVKQETERIDSRFLEPACGNGNFLAEILRRKLVVVGKRYGKSMHDYEVYSVVAITSLYGVDIMEDNVEECRERLFDIWNQEYTAHVKAEANEQCREAVRFILYKNILCGDALTMLQTDGSPIIFAEWSLVTGEMIKRRDFALDRLLNAQESEIDLFSEKYDEKEKGYIPEPIREYPLVNYRKVQDYE